MEDESGFNSKEVEIEYYNSLYKLIFLIQQQFLELIKLVDKPQINHNLFSKHFKILYNRLVVLDSKKRQAPLFSYSFHSLADYYKENEQCNQQKYEKNHLNSIICHNEEKNDNEEIKRKIKIHKKRSFKNKEESVKLPEIPGKEILFG